MKFDKSLQEVWDWKEKVYQDTKDFSIKELLKNIHDGAEAIRQKYGLKLKKLQFVSK